MLLVPLALFQTQQEQHAKIVPSVHTQAQLKPVIDYFEHLLPTNALNASALSVNKELMMNMSTEGDQIRSSSVTQ